MNHSFLNKLSSSAFARLAFFLCACAAAIAFGIVGIGRSGELFQGGFDMQFMYVAGLTWRQGLNAYDPQIASQVSNGIVLAERYDFAYPPQIAPLSLFLSLFAFEKARAIVIFLNIAALVSLSLLCVRLVTHAEVKELRNRGLGLRWFIPALIVGNPFTAHVLWMGQTTLMGMAALVGGWYCARRDRWLVGGVLIAISTIKPQLCLLAILWLLLERQWKLLAVAGCTALAFSAVPMMVSGPVNVFVEWLGAIAGYKSQIYNTLGFRHIVGIQNMLFALGIKVPQLLPVALILTVVLWWYRSRFCSTDILGILLGITFLFGFAHDYDLLALAPVISMFWMHLRERPVAQIGAIALMLGMFFPQRFIRPLNIEVLLHFRVFLLLAITLWLLAMSYRQATTLQTAES